MDPPLTLPTLTSDLSLTIDDLSSTLTPLLSPLPSTLSTLPLLEKAKLHILLAYAIESLLFSSLQVSGSDAKSHAIYAELSRLRAYFAKVKNAEEVAAGPRTKLDVEAAARFVRHGLSGNERVDEARRERERVVAEKKKAVNRKFEDEEGEAAVRKRDRTEEEEEDVSQLDAAEGDGAVDSPAPAKKKRGRPSKKTAAAPASTQPPEKPSTPARQTRSSALAATPTSSKPKSTGKGRGKTQ